MSTNLEKTRIISRKIKAALEETINNASEEIRFQIQETILGQPGEFVPLADSTVRRKSRTGKPFGRSPDFMLAENWNMFNDIEAHVLIDSTNISNSVALAGFSRSNPSIEKAIRNEFGDTAYNIPDRPFLRHTANKQSLKVALVAITKEAFKQQFPQK